MIIFEACECTDSIKFCGCIPSCPFYVPGEQKQAHQSKWMTLLGQVKPEAKLRDIIVPGTHDSGTWGIPSKSFCNAVARTQQFDFYQQATMGLRLFDIRWVIQKEMTVPAVFHGPFESIPVETVFQQLRKFLDENPQEFLVLSLQSEHGIKSTSVEQFDILFQIVLKYFKDIAITAQDQYSWFNIPNTSLGEIQSRKRQVLIFGDAETCPSSPPNSLPRIPNKKGGYSMVSINQPQLVASWEEETLLGKSKTRHAPPAQHEAYEIIHFVEFQLDSHWYDSNKVQSILLGNLRNLESKKNNREVILVSQFNLTTKYNPETILLQLLGIQSNRLDHQIKRMLWKKQFLFFLRNNSWRPWNYMWFDFPNKYPMAIQFLQGLNFSAAAKLLVISASVNDSDVTQNVRNLTSRGTALYIVDFKEDLALEYSHGKFEIEVDYIVNQVSQGVKKLELQFNGCFDKSQFLMTFPIYSQIQTRPKFQFPRQLI